MVEPLTREAITEWAENASNTDVWRAYKALLHVAQERIGNRQCPACLEFGIEGSYPPSERERDNT